MTRQSARVTPDAECFSFAERRRLRPAQRPLPIRDSRRDIERECTHPEQTNVGRDCWALSNQVTDHPFVPHSPRARSGWPSVRPSGAGSSRSTLERASSGECQGRAGGAPSGKANAPLQRRSHPVNHPHVIQHERSRRRHPARAPPPRKRFSPLGNPRRRAPPSPLTLTVTR